MKLGSIIKFHRLNQNITLESLAEEIISVSYLSRIENNQIVPANEIYKLLLKKLNVDLDAVNQNEKDVLELLENWKVILLHNDKEEAEKLFDTISEKVSLSQNHHTTLYFHILQIRYYILQVKHTEVYDLIATIEPFYNELSTELQYYYLKHKGNFYYVVQNYFDAEKLLSATLKLLSNFTPDLEEEKADLFYLYALSLSMNRKDALAIYYIESALQIYKDIYHTKRCAESHVLLGMSYRRIQNTTEAISHYKKAKALGEMLNLELLLAQIEHNLGYLKARMKSSKEAISHLEKSYKLKKKHSQKGLNTILALVQEYYYIDEKDTCIEWLQKGFDLFSGDRSSLNSEERILYIQFKYYDYVFNNYTGDYESFMEVTFFPFLKEQEKFNLLALYAKRHSGYYIERKKYKKATEYLQLCNRSYQKLFNI